ncbi:hypothetical protein [Catenuloplanes japonicus]|uniref:hypothetical protein n=1 Tax=Catenuloplanes japonicus TaxID=33876 RepID=UPI0005244401|nr:hypothetical protein [Catenuloplanes japonicus]
MFRKLLGGLAAMVMTAGVLTVTAAPASAAVMSCNYESGYNACLTLEYAGNARWDVTVGYDRHLPADHAAYIVNTCGLQIFAVAWGDDGGHPDDDDLGYIPLKPGSPIVTSFGFSAEFFRAAMNLNEDNGTDEIYAEVTYYDCIQLEWVTHETGVITI